MKSFSRQCNDCNNEVFHSEFDFIEHQNIHSGETPFMCLMCRKSFSLIKQYVDHLKSECNFDCGLNRPSKESGDIVINHGKDKKAVEGVELETDSSHSLKENADCGNKCSKCHKVFLKQNDLEKHLKRHSNKKSKSNRKLGLKSVKSRTLNSYCALCKIDFKLVKKLKAHKRKVHTFICKNCSKKFSTDEKLARHTCIIPAMDEGFKCSCSQIFAKPEAFKFHIGSKPFICCSCSMKFNTITNLIRHIRTHTKQKPYICKDCGRRFSQSAHLRNHSSLHLGISAVKCNECDFSCKTFNGLLKHKKKHREGFIKHQKYVDGRKKSTAMSECPICKKQFLFKRNMGMHMKIHSSKATLCTECGKVFVSKSKLTSHYKACHREPSMCKVCGKVFASAVLLSAHERIHIRDKLFSCSLCEKTFSIKNYLVQHMKTHSNKKQFSCGKCGKLFKVAVSLKYHSNICKSIGIHD